MLPLIEKDILSVSQLNRHAKQLLETHLPMIWVSGELSNLAKPGSGHWYFSLKDERAQVRCAMFKNANQGLRQTPESGQQVLVRARVSLYEGRGDYQLIVEHIETAGAGALQKAYEILKLKLQQEGLFAESQKQEIPAFPSHIGLITSPTGAAVHDILSVLARRYPIVEVSVIPVSVQGSTAATEMIAALKKAQSYAKFDLLIIGRGGGSIEDLWAFNNEDLARAIAECKIPIISAVGHEVDVTICDWVADLRAATPSASAELATPDIEEWKQNIDLWQQQFIKQLRLLLHKKQQQLAYLQKRLRHPSEKIHYQRQQLAHISKSLHTATKIQITKKQQDLERQLYRLHRQHPKVLISPVYDKLNHISQRLQEAVKHRLNHHQQHLSNLAQILNAVSPLQVLNRGYSIVTRADKSVVKSSRAIQLGDTVFTRLGSGIFASQVSSIDHAQEDA